MEGTFFKEQVNLNNLTVVSEVCGHNNCVLYTPFRNTQTQNILSEMIPGQLYLYTFNHHES